MFRFAVLILACLVVAGCGGDDDDEAPPARAPATELTVTVWPEGRGGLVQERQVECPRADVCAELSVLSFAPVPRNMACTAIYGGPAEARVTGTLRGEPVNARFSLEDGCQIARWEANRELLGPPPGRGP
jgi:hypothetical protein